MLKKILIYFAITVVFAAIGCYFFFAEKNPGTNNNKNTRTTLIHVPIICNIAFPPLDVLELLYHFKYIFDKTKRLAQGFICDIL